MSIGAGAHVIGLISDTHGLVRADVARVQDQLYAGGADVLTELEVIAPVRAVRGNTDPPDEPPLPSAIDLIIGGVSIHVSHGHEVGSPTPEKLLGRYDADVIVYGHTHKPLATRVGTRWVVNPGAAGPRRFDLLPSVAKLTILGADVEVEMLDLAL